MRDRRQEEGDRVRADLIVRALPHQKPVKEQLQAGRRRRRGGQSEYRVRSVYRARGNLRIGEASSGAAPSRAAWPRAAVHPHAVAQISCRRIDLPSLIDHGRPADPKPHAFHRPHCQLVGQTRYVADLHRCKHRRWSDNRSRRYPHIPHPQDHRAGRHRPDFRELVNALAVVGDVVLRTGRRGCRRNHLHAQNSVHDRQRQIRRRDTGCVTRQKAAVPDEHRSRESRAVRAIENILYGCQRGLRHRCSNSACHQQRQLSPTEHPTRLPSDSVSKRMRAGNVGR